MKTVNDLITQLQLYQPFNEQEQKDKELILSSLLNENNIFTRQNALAHMTASAWVLNRDFSKVLMCYHNIYHSWSWLGGHADGCEDLLQVAIKEVKEEAGINSVVPVSYDIFSIESLTVDGHMKRGSYVSSHLHLNVTYLLMADEQELLSTKEDENSDIGWFSLDEAVKASTEPWFQERIYKKLNDKLALMGGNYVNRV